jgi:hypothetical protein
VRERLHGQPAQGAKDEEGISDGQILRRGEGGMRAFRLVDRVVDLLE